MARALYELTAELNRLNDLLEECEGDLSRLGDMEPAVTAWLESLEGEQAMKLDGYILLIRQLQAEAAAAKAEEELWAAKRRARESRAKFLELRLKSHLEKTGQARVTTAAGRVVSVVKNGGVPPLEIKAGTNLYELPDEFVNYEPVLNKAAVRAVLEAGGELAFAELLPRGTSLRIK